MKKLIIFLIAALLSGCTGYSNTNYRAENSKSVQEIQFEIEAQQLEKDQIAKKITLAQLAQGLYDAQQKYIPEETAYGKYLATRVLIARQLESGEITKEEYKARHQLIYAEYADTMQQQRNNAQANQAMARRTNDLQRAAANAYLLNSIGDGFRNAYQPPPKTFVNCQSSALGGVVSTTCY